MTVNNTCFRAHMKTIAICSQKGGSGKSTLARHGSVLLTKSALLDLDPQGTSKSWLDKRKAVGLKYPTGVITDWTKVQTVKDRAIESGFQHLVIDTAQSMTMKNLSAQLSMQRI